MLKIDKKSWHYRCYKNSFRYKVDAEADTNLCPYFWRILAGLVLAIFLTAVIGGIVAPFMLVCVAIGTIVAPFYMLVTGKHPPKHVVDKSHGFWRRLGDLFFWWVDSLMEEGEWVRWREPTASAPKPKRYKAPGLFALWLKAKKERVCPQITFTTQQAGEEHAGQEVG